MGGQTRARRRRRLQALQQAKGLLCGGAKHDLGEDELAAVLGECLDEMQRNGVDMEAALARHPDLAEAIRPLLEVAAMLQRRKT